MTTVSRTAVLLDILRQQLAYYDAAQRNEVNVFGEPIISDMSASAAAAIRMHLSEIDAGRDAIDMTDSLA